MTTASRVPRFGSNLKTRQTWKRSGIYQIDDTQTETVAPASTQKTYLACENFAVEGQAAMHPVTAEYRNLNGVDYGKVQGIRIVEVRVVRAANGQTLYIPQETDGGFVQTWAAKGRGMQPRILLGAEVDPVTWSLRK